MILLSSGHAFWLVLSWLAVDKTGRSRVVEIHKKIWLPFTFTPCLHLVLRLKMFILRHRTVLVWICLRLWETLMFSLLWISFIAPIQPIMWMHIGRPNNLFIRHRKVIRSPQRMVHVQVCTVPQQEVAVIRHPRRSGAEVKVTEPRPQVSPVSQFSKAAHGINQGIHDVHTNHARSLAHQKLSRYTWWIDTWFILRAGLRKRKDQIGTLTRVWKGTYICICFL